MSELKIEFPKEYTLEESNQKMGKKLNKLNQKGLEQISHFIGSSTIESMFYLYLLKKYKSPCFLTETSEIFWEILGINLNIREIYSEEESVKINSYLKRLAEKLVICINNDVNIIIIPLNLIFHYPNGKGGHSNVLIYRKKFNHIEHFEPYGKISELKNRFGYKKLYSSIELFIKLFVEYVNIELFKHKTPAQIQYIKPVELIDSNRVCPYFSGFQMLEEESKIIRNLEIEPKGYCSAWSMFFTELCLKNPAMTSNQIISSVFATSSDKLVTREYFRYVIRGYSTFINEKISTYFRFLQDNNKINIAKIKKMSVQEQHELKEKMKTIINIEISLTINPNALDERIMFLHLKLLDIRNQQNEQKIIVKEYFQTQLELLILKKYKNYIGDFNSPINTPSTLSFTQTNKKKNKKTKTIKEEKRREEKICPSGKELNPKTNRCVKIKSASVMKIIKEQKKKLEEELSKKTKVCPPGKELNQDTGRCNKIKTKTMKIRKEEKIKKEKEPLNKSKECPPGKELNTKTNRCVKIKTKTIKIKLNKIK